MAIGKRAAVDAVLRGISAGNAKYEEITSGSWLTDSGAEGFMAAHVAHALSNEMKKDGSLLVEAPFAGIREWSGAGRRRGRPREVLRGRRRVDIVLFDRQGRPTHVVELKRHWNPSRCYTDIQRLRDLLHACAGEMDGSLKYGLLGLLIVEGGFTSEAAEKKVQNKAQWIEDEIRSEFRFDRRKTTFHIGDMMRYPERYREAYNVDRQWAAAGLCMAVSG